jgi:hypothetical protein
MPRPKTASLKHTATTQTSTQRKDVPNKELAACLKAHLKQAANGQFECAHTRQNFGRHDDLHKRIITISSCERAMG